MEKKTGHAFLCPCLHFGSAWRGGCLHALCLPSVACMSARQWQAGAHPSLQEEEELSQSVLPLPFYACPMHACLGSEHFAAEKKKGEFLTISIISLPLTLLHSGLGGGLSARGRPPSLPPSLLTPQNSDRCTTPTTHLPLALPPWQRREGRRTSRTFWQPSTCLPQEEGGSRRRQEQNKHVRKVALIDFSGIILFSPFAHEEKETSLAATSHPIEGNLLMPDKI